MRSTRRPLDGDKGAVMSLHRASVDVVWKGSDLGFLKKCAENAQKIRKNVQKSCKKAGKNA